MKDKELKEAKKRLGVVLHDVEKAWHGRAGLGEDLHALTLAVSLLSDVLEGRLVRPASREKINKILWKANDEWHNTHGENEQGYFWYIAGQLLGKVEGRMKINITQVMNELYKRDYLDKMHRTIKEGLVGSLRNEYIMSKPLREPYKKYVEEVNTFVGLPIFHALVDMMVANLLHFVSKELVSEVLNAIEDIAHQSLKEGLNRFTAEKEKR